MSKSEPPASPDPVNTARASTSTNVATAVANAFLGNVNQITPQGSLQYSPSDTYQFYDPYTGYTTNIPIFTATQTLSPQQQATQNQTNQTQFNLASLGNQQSQRMAQILGMNFDPSQVFGEGDPHWLTTTPSMQYGLDYTGSPQGSFDVSQFSPQLTYDTFGNPRFDFQPGELEAIGPQNRTFGDVSGPSRTFGDAGNITRTYGNPDALTSRANVEKALFERMQPQNDRDRQILEQRLADQGLNYGSAAYNAAMDEYQKGLTDQRLGITAAGGQEQKLQEDIMAQRAGFENAAQMQAYQQAYGRGVFSNQAQAQEFEQARQRGEFSNAAQIQAFSQALQRNQFTNAAIKQANDDLAARAGFANQGRAQGYSQGINAAQFANQAQRDMFTQSGARADLYNQGVAADRARMQQILDAWNTRHTTDVGEAYAARNQPLNEISALMSGSQISMPNFINTASTKIPTTDVAGLINNKFSQSMDVYKQQSQNFNSLMGGIFGMLGGLARSDERTKENIHRVGSIFVAEPQAVAEPKKHQLPVYEYSFKDDPASTRHIGPMAQDVEAVDPEGVVDIAGVKHIDTGRFMGNVLRA